MDTPRSKAKGLPSLTRPNTVTEVQQQPTGYASLKERKSTGAHYTPKALADFAARETVEAWTRKPGSGSIRVLDPAVGDGELLLSILGSTVHSARLNFVEAFKNFFQGGGTDYKPFKLERG